MAIIHCRECGKEVSDQAPTCPHCGCPMSQETLYGVIHFHWDDPKWSLLVKTDVFIDGKNIGSMKCSEQMDISVPFGVHTVELILNRKCAVRESVVIGETNPKEYFIYKKTVFTLERIHDTDVRGTRERKKIKATQTAFGLVFAVSIIVFSWLITSQPNDSPEVEPSVSASGSIPVEEPPINISARNLYNAYTQNTVNADALYKNKRVAVTGTITNIGQDMVTKKPCISLDSGSDLNLYPVQCFFQESSSDLASLRDGDSVTIVGECTGFFVANVQLSDCTLQQ